jgi:hypothetical protein
MRILITALLALALAVAALAQPPAASPAALKDIVTYVGAGADTAFTCVLSLSDGTVLVGGSATSLDWLPQDVQRTQLFTFGIANDMGSGKHNSTLKPHIPFLLQLSADFTSVLRIVALPAGSAEDIRWIKTTSLPNEHTGDLFISGTTQDTREKSGGYFIAKLNNNFVKGTPTAFAWVRNIWATGAQQSEQPWDVGSDGRVVYVTGQPNGADFCAVQRLQPNGTDDLVPDWHSHWTAEGKVFYGTLTSENAALYVRSSVLLKPSEGADLRSWSKRDTTARLADGNGGTKTGRWPLDQLFKLPANPTDPTKTLEGPGAAGWWTSGTATGHVGGIAVDRRTNDFYVGCDYLVDSPTARKTTPCVLAYSATGSLKWYSHLQPDTAVGNEASLRVEGLACDFSTTPAQLVVLGQATSTSNIMFWKGSEVLARKVPGVLTHGFQDQYTGPGNRSVFWLGKLSGAEGQLLAATYIGELAENPEQIGPAATDPLLGGWPDLNGGWPTLENTIVRSGMSVDSAGCVYLTGVGQRTLTTANAYQQMLKPGEGKSYPNTFVRVYTPALDGVIYSSLLTGKVTDGASLEGITLLGATCPVRGGVLTVGVQPGEQSPAPTTAIPGWGSAKPAGKVTALLGRLGFTKK